jgi:hypothetical protein
MSQESGPSQDPKPEQPKSGPSQDPRGEQPKPLKEPKPIEKIMKEREGRRVPVTPNEVPDLPQGPNI